VTLPDDLARARELLDKGRARADALATLRPQVRELSILKKGGVIDYGDIYAAYRLLESFVNEIAALNDEIAALGDLTSRTLDMVERVEWVPRESGKAFVCPFCHAIGELYGGPGHQDDCEWQLVTRLGNELRLKGVLR